jgi:predicted enzyme related to lactoylglutathione lyase
MTHNDGSFSAMILGLRTVIYRVSDLDRAVAWYSAVFETKPYCEFPFYVGFNIGGFELGVDPDLSEGPVGPGGSVAYWGVDAIEPAFERFVSLGASVVIPVKDVGAGIKVATVSDSDGNLIGLIENPHFSLSGS